MKEFLISKGFKITTESCVLRFNEFAEYVAFSKLESDKLCICNDKPPQIMITHNFGEICDHEIDSYNVELVQENNLGWLKIQYYGLREDELKNNLDSILASMKAAWEAGWV